MPATSSDTRRRDYLEKNPGLFEELEKRAERDGRVELSLEEVHAICDAHRNLRALLSRTTRVSDLAHRQLLESRKLLQSEILAVRSANYELSSLDAEKNDVLALAAHDLRSPLATIHSLADALAAILSPAPGTDVSEFLDDIRTLSAQAAGLVTSILDGYRAAAGRLIPKPAPVRTRDLAADLLSTWKSTAEFKRIALETEFAPDDPEFLLDGDLFRRVADNLLSNALKYSPQGGTVVFSLRWTNDQLEFAVRDQGPGISPAEQVKLFKRFSRLSAQATGGEESEGLGLALSSRILNLLGGTITYERLEPHGSVFRVRLPCPASDQTTSNTHS